MPDRRFGQNTPVLPAGFANFLPVRPQQGRAAAEGTGVFLGEGVRFPRPQLRGEEVGAASGSRARPLAPTRALQPCPARESCPPREHLSVRSPGVQ